MSRQSTPEEFREAVRLAAAEQVDRDRAMLADAEELAGAGSFTYDFATGSVRWSPGMYRIRGIEPSSELTVEQADGLDPRDADRIHEAFADALASDATVFDLTYRIVRPDGEVRWCETRYRIERDAGGLAVRGIGMSIDVTARREADRLRAEAERTARERERLLHGVIDNNMALIYVKDLDGRYLLYNTSFANAFGLEERAAAEHVAASEVLLGRDDAWLDPALAPVWRENDLRACTSAYELEEFSEHPDGGRRTFDSIKFPLFDDDGAIYATCGVSLETTERTRERDELAVAARHFELSRDLVCTAGFDGVFQKLNAAWTETLGWSEAELRSRPFVEFVHPDDREQAVRAAAGLAQGDVTVAFVNRYATKDGGWRWLDWNSMAVLEEGLIYASARDVTDRKAAEAALEAGEAQTRQIVETAHDAFVSIDARGVISAWNPQAEATFGWSREEALGRELAATIIPAVHREAHRHGIERFLATGQARVLGKRLELTALHRDGREFPAELTISAVETESGYSFNAFVRDITERNRAQAELALARDEALEASKMKSMFVANVSHEIRTPMNGVIGMTELLLETALVGEQREFAETISSSGEALLEVIDDILDFSKIEAGKLELDPTDFDLREAIERACGMLAARAHAKGLELVVAIDPEVPTHVHGDSARLRQVIANFVSNSIKFTAGGEVVVHVRSSPAHAGAALVRLEVSDTGIGIEREALEHLFVPFSQADSSTTRKYGGTGLGLAISRQLIDLMGGDVGAESEPGKGSTFWFEVSLERALAGAEPDDGPAEGHRETAGMRVLVVDDNATNRSILERQLSSWEMTCAVADHAARALELLESAAEAGTPYALALLDLNMPDVDGYELARTIRARPALRDMRLVLLTSSGGRSDVPDEVTLDGSLSKPVTHARLYEEIQAAVAGELPLPQRARTPAPAAADTLRPDVPRDVLLVEDTPVNQAVAGRMLEKCGFRVQIAENGRAALDDLLRKPYTAVLMDCQMPELDGYETTREIRRRELGGPRIPIIAMTANSMQGDRERCLAAGMDDYVTKPLRTQTLRDALKRWVAEPPVESTAAEEASATSPPRTPHGDGPVLLHETVVAELESFAGDLLPDLVSLYFDEAPALVSALDGAIDRGETLSASQTAHKLKGSSSTLGAAHVSGIASELEATAKAGDLPAAHELLDDLRAALDETHDAFRMRLATATDDLNGRGAPC